MLSYNMCIKKRALRICECLFTKKKLFTMSRNVYSCKEFLTFFEDGNTGFRALLKLIQSKIFKIIYAKLLIRLYHDQCQGMGSRYTEKVVSLQQRKFLHLCKGFFLFSPC